VKALGTSFAMALLISAAVANPASAVPATVANGPCNYVVQYNLTAVYESASEQSPVRKYKNAGEPVSGPCIRSGDFTAVDCTCAGDLIGWIRTGRLA
jgi:hypothetical protein